MPNEAPQAEPPEKAPAANAVSPKTVNSSFPPPADQPTQIGPRGIRYDINHGARISLPERSEGHWRIRLTDLDSGNILFQNDSKGAFVRSSKRFFVRFGIDVWDVNEAGVETSVLSHKLDLRDREVLVHFPIGTLGDTMGWFAYAARLAETTGARVTCSLSKLIIPLLKDAYPNLRLVTPEEVVEQKLSEQAYATYCLGLFFDDAVFEWQPTDFRYVGLHRTAGYILGVDPTEEAPRIVIPDDSRPIAEPYVCIAVQASTQAKMWNNPNGWREVISFLKARGFRVICIDQKPVHGGGIVWNHIPHGAEDETGNRPLAERARWLRHAAAFIGLSSGLTWLAWAAGCPIVMISGFTHPSNEFDTPYRVINWHTCNSCWNDPRHRFDHHDYLYCPRHKGTDRQFECTRLITPAQVIRALERVPAVAATTQYDQAAD
ncbi:autotransporter strand-loop-strand O-heptosyltransferase [Acidisoma silvae]|uniref:Autotransporter strand-loop-strand O-heptosyltransferase n=1 Tax=Acidisoma silvae TaxID=2802396 RepID=A0A963YPN7_9PROT|nr:autotransporter strand-loop-strand O-heptosyltransferase [Acidisoma silvae]MCB8874461.1 autotransporter strand-loop-strand O-heptosyltransferase [Acidisoma silvae]